MISLFIILIHLLIIICRVIGFNFIISAHNDSNVKDELSLNYLLAAEKTPTSEQNAAHWNLEDVAACAFSDIEDDHRTCYIFDS